MGHFHSQSAGHQLMVGCLILDLFFLFPIFKAQSCSHKRGVKDHIDLIKSQPESHIFLISGKERPTETKVKINHFPASPASILFNQRNGTVKMGDGHQRLYPVFSALLKDLFIKPQSFLIGLFFISIWKNSGPGNTQTENLKSHFSKQPDILPEAVVKIHRPCAGISMFLIHFQHFPVSCDHWISILSCRTHIYIGKASSSFKNASFILVGGRGSAP